MRVAIGADHGGFELKELAKEWLNKTGYKVIDELNNTDKVMNDSFWIGVYPGMTDKKIDYMVSQINELLEKN